MENMLKRIEKQYIKGTISRLDVIEFMKSKVITRDNARDIIRKKEVLENANK